MPKKSEKSTLRKIVSPPLWVDPNQRYPIPVANALLGQSNSKTYEDIAAGRLKVIKDGRRSYIHGSEIIRRSAVGLDTSLEPAPAIQDGTFPRRIPVDRASSRVAVPSSAAV
jgi:hypothetical protein